jgi:tetratricopeptide (TPR) repeat protein
MIAAAYWMQRGLAMAFLWAGWSRLTLAFVNRLLVLRPHDLYAGVSRGNVLADLGQKTAAINGLQQLVVIHPTHAASWYQLAYLLESTARHAESEPAFRAALALEPEMDAAWYGLAMLLAREERLEEAVIALEHTTRLQPRSPHGWYQLARIHARLTQPEKALEVIRRLRSFEPQAANLLASEIGLSGLK